MLKTLKIYICWTTQLSSLNKWAKHILKKGFTVDKILIANETPEKNIFKINKKHQCCTEWKPSRKYSKLK